MNTFNAESGKGRKGAKKPRADDKRDRSICNVKSCKYSEPESSENIDCQYANGQAETFGFGGYDIAKPEAKHCAKSAPYENTR